MKLKRFLSDSISFGKGSVKIPSAEIIEKFKNQYDAMLTRGLKFKVSIYRPIGGNGIIVHTKVPSETVDGFYYDVLIELISNGATDFEECDIKIFSNSPSFVYTYAYVFYNLEDDESKSKGLIIDEYHKKIPKDNIMITGTSKKLSEEILHGKPIIRNPFGIPLFDKSIYYAIFNMVDKLDFNITIHSKKLIRQKQLFDLVEDFETLMIHRKSLADKNREKKKLEKLAIEKTFKKVESKIDTLSRGNSTKIVNKIKEKKSSSVNKTNKVKPIGKK